jgi:hypothetical protein
MMNVVEVEASLKLLKYDQKILEVSEEFLRVANKVPGF